MVCCSLFLFFCIPFTPLCILHVYFLVVFLGSLSFVFNIYTSYILLFAVYFPVVFLGSLSFVFNIYSSYTLIKKELVAKGKHAKR